VVGMLAIKAGALDEEYLRRWAKQLHVEDLLAKAFQNAQA